MTDETNIVTLPLENGGALTTPITPQAMLATAVAAGNTELAEKLMDLADRWEAKNNRKAFNTAITKAKAEIPVIIKNKEMNAGAGRTTYKYEDMAAIAREVDPILSKYGLGYRFRTKAENDLITVTCIIFHEDGHAEENSLPGKPDMSGSKNAIQGLGSVLTYLQRYLLKAALGLATSADDDGNGGFISDDQHKTLSKIITAVGGDITKFLDYLKIPSLSDLSAKEYQRAIDAILTKVKK